MDAEQDVLHHYNLTTAYPVEWPPEKDNSDASDDEPQDTPRSKFNTRPRTQKPRYSALYRSGSDRQPPVPVLGKPGDCLENLVQKDEPDPLGSTESVVRILRQRGLPVDDDLRLKNRFLLSSTTFSPGLFLSQVHSNASTHALLQGLEVLSRSIDQKSASLKVLVESNFERFVRAKSTIDNVYTQMRSQGAEPERDKPPTHSRNASKNSAHFRNISGSGLNKPLPSDKKKNALTKESEYGVQGIKAPLIELSVKAGEVWGPALGGREREETLKAVLASVERHRGIFEVGGAIADCIKRRDFESLVEEYYRARRYSEDAKETATAAVQNNSLLSDAQVHQIIITARMWAEVEAQMDIFKRDLWRRLVGAQTTSPGSKSVPGSARDEHMSLIGVLLELGTQDNPIEIWLLTRYEYLKNKIQTTSERFRLETEVIRRHLAATDKPSPQAVATHLTFPARKSFDDSTATMDTTNVIEMWERIHASLQALLGSKRSVLSEVIEFRETSQSFIQGRSQRTLPVGPDGQSRKHHRLSQHGVKELQDGSVELLNLLRDNVLSFFVEPPVEDVSLLFSPIPSMPATPATPATPRSGLLTPLTGTRFNFDPNTLPPPSPKSSDPWARFAYWPPHSNSLSAVHYLGRILVLIGTAASEMIALSSAGEVTGMLDRLRTLVGGVRESCTQAVCAAWNRDAERCRVLEDWTRSTETRELTRMPSSFVAYESSVLGGIQKILYVSEAMSKPGAADVVLPPPAKLLQTVRGQFVSSLYKALSGMVENAENPIKLDPGKWDAEGDGIAHPVANVAPAKVTAQTVDASDRNVRMLLTLSNLQAVRSEIVPQLVTQFENAFSVKLTEENKTIRDVLGQIDARLFQSYTKPYIEMLFEVIRSGVLSRDWTPTEGRPSAAKPYVYTVLLALVSVHAQVSTNAASLTPQILSYLLEQASQALLVAFKQRDRYSLAALMQATLDVEFIAQTLQQYTTDKAADIQSKIYLELDRGTDNEARMQLQNELPEMRKVLKGLRESSKAEFACFKKIRIPRERVERQQT
ncbi:MAG: hypothetical protein M1817_003425 [Caeruleum heppii]|nr:MAG: hypothetical protein M1817_003425 [Caeruleum heppii]